MQTDTYKHMNLLPEGLAASNPASGRTDVLPSMAQNPVAVAAPVVACCMYSRCADGVVVDTPPVAVQGAASLEVAKVGEVLQVPLESITWWPQRCPSDIV